MSQGSAMRLLWVTLDKQLGNFGGENSTQQNMFEIGDILAVQECDANNNNNLIVIRQHKYVFTQ